MWENTSFLNDFLCLKFFFFSLNKSINELFSTKWLLKIDTQHSIKSDHKHFAIAAD